jgi:GntR family transcriptional regulator, transcriptional repressor for pyruvate dehydrogenase complex
MATTDGDVERARNSLRRQSTSDLVKNEILNWLEAGRYTAGQSLPSEREMQAEFNVSRVSIREAMVGLEAVGLIEIHQGRGCFVSPQISEVVRRPFAVWLRMYRDEVISLLKVRSVLDGLAAYEAVSKNDHDLIAKVRAAHEAFKEAAAHGADAPRLALLDKIFHRSIAEASGIGIVQHLLLDLNENVANSHRITMALEGRPRQSAKEHSRILSAILAGDSEEARQEAADHVMGIVSIIEAYIGGRADAEDLTRLATPVDVRP